MRKHVLIPVYRHRHGPDPVAYAFVDSGDEPMVAPMRWYVDGDGYAMASVGRRYNVRMHRLIMGVHTGDPFVVDHENRDPLDNRRKNLRFLTVSQNQQNRYGARADSRSGFRGVVKWGNRFVGRAKLMGRTHHTDKSYATPKEAAQAAVALRRSLGFVSA